LRINFGVFIFYSVCPQEIQNFTEMSNCDVRGTVSFVVVQLEVNQSVTGLEWPRGFEEVKIPRLRDNGLRWW